MIRTTLVTLIVAGLLAGGPGVEAQDFTGTNLSSQELPYREPPYSFEGSRYLIVTFATSPEVLQALVPEPLTANSDGMMTVIIAQQKVVQPGKLTYGEAILSVPVSLGELQGSYLPVLYLDRTLGIISGRELWGYNKVDGEFEWVEAEDGTVHAKLVRDGVTLIEIRAQLGEPLAQIPEIPRGPVFNLRHIPGMAPGAPPDIKQLTSMLSDGYEITKMRPGQGELTLGSSATDPLGSIPVLKVLNVAYTEQNFTLRAAEVVHDYLKSE